MSKLFNRVKYWLIAFGVTVSPFAFAVIARAAGTAPTTPAPASDTTSAIGSAINQYVISPLVGLLSQVVLILVDFLIKVVSYTGYANSPAVTTGWIVVRDIANMFFVAMFLVIAIGTIVNPGKFQGMRAIVRLLLYALFVNFSKTIVLLCVDASNIVMLTFVNGFKAAAGGNFVDALGMRSLVSLNPSEKFPLTGLIGAQFLALIMMVIIVVLIGIILIAMVMRMVTLWFLIVISPLAFAMGGTEFTKPRYAEWWKRFSAQLTTGPLVAFFLWLTLATVQQQPNGADIAGAGAISGAGLTCGPSNFCQEATIMRFVIAALMLLGGLMFAKEFEGVGGELAGAAMNKGKNAMNAVGRRAIKGAAIGVGIGAAPMLGAAVAGGYLASRSSTFRDTVGKGLVRVPGLRGAGARLRASAAKQRQEKLKKQEELEGFLPMEQKAKRLYTKHKDGSVSRDLLVSDDVALATGKALLTDKKWLGTASDEEKVFVMKNVDELAKKFNDKTGKDKVSEVEKLNPNLIPADKKASDPRYGSRYEEITETMSASDWVKADAAAYTPKTVQSMTPDAIEKVLKDGTPAQHQALSAVLKGFAMRPVPAAGATDKIREDYYAQIKNNKRDVDTLSVAELAVPDVVVEVFEKNPTDKKREDLLRDKEKRAEISKTATTELTAQRAASGTAFTHTDRTRRLAEAAAISDDKNGMKNGYQYNLGDSAGAFGQQFATAEDKKAFAAALHGKNKEEIIFNLKPQQIQDGSGLADALGDTLQFSDFVALTKKAEGNSGKEDIIKAIISAMNSKMGRIMDDAKKNEIKAKLDKLKTDRVTGVHAIGV